MSKELVAAGVIDFGNAIALQTTSITIGTIETNADRILATVKERVEAYKDVTRYMGHTDEAKSDRALLRKQKDSIKTQEKTIIQHWNEPLEVFRSKLAEVYRYMDIAIDGIDECVKEVEAQEKGDKREVIEKYFEGKNFDLVPLEMLFDKRWLNKTEKITDVKKELDGKIADIYKNIKILENIPEHGMTAKAMYLETLDIGAALQHVDTMKRNAERLAREKAEREAREQREEVERNVVELKAEKKQDTREDFAEMLAAEAVGASLDIGAEIETPKAQALQTVTLRFTGTREALFELKAWMSEHGISYEKIQED